MLEKFNQELKKYLESWDKYYAPLKNHEFFKGAKPTAIGWKTSDLAEFDAMLAELRTSCDQIHCGWVNERWLATLHLKEVELTGGIQLIKLMQRRPGSTDPVGLDHVDFYIPDKTLLETALKHETGVKWTNESNNPHCSWVSIWFEDTEAKLRDNSVLDVCIAELQEANDSILGT